MKLFAHCLFLGSRKFRLDNSLNTFYKSIVYRTLDKQFTKTTFLPHMSIRKQISVETQIKDADLVREKQLQIAVGATKLFIEKGYAQTSIREISKAAGLTIGNLYDYITKKEDVLYLVFNVFHSIWVNKLQEEKVFEIADPCEQLKTALQKMSELVDNYRDMIRLMYTESKLLPKGFLKNILEKESGLVECFEQILRKGVQEGVFAVQDPFFFANVIVYLLSIEPLRGWNLRKRYTVAEVDKRIYEMILSLVKDR